MKRWKKWFLWSVSCLVVLAGAGYFTMNFAVSYMLKSMVSTTQIVAQQDNTNEAEVNSSKDVGQELVQPRSKSVESSANSSEVPSTNPIESPVTSSNSSSKDSNPVRNETTPTPTSTQTSKELVLDYTPQVTEDKANEVEETISLQDKAAVTTIILKKLSPTEIQTFARMAGNGLSIEEKKKAKEVMLKKLTEDEYNSLVNIAVKYGLSQGKDYQHALKRMEQSK